MSTDNIVICENKEETAAKFAEIFVDMVEDSENTLTVALSGGSTPKILFDILSENYNGDVPWERLRFYWGDERCVPMDHSDSNYGMTKLHLFNNINIDYANIFRVRGEDNPIIEAERYSKLIETNLPIVNNLPEFDLVILGMGDDGHTASIFPNQFELMKSDKTCEIATHPQSGQKRITLTGKIINNAKKKLFLVTGKSKAAVVGEIFNQLNDFTVYPAAHINNAIWFLDKEAANEL
ncbi:MAG: 6-phosphogluconolactonase [Melioribacteraceae bacterium]|nr:6-phosphogluconolactonase [Melioribacteraceae bacterium]MCF8264530.1 6-phosphogluconolactonase [Melioribacteraceae bacterium]